MTVEILVGDAAAVLRGLPADHFQCCVTSPPYYGLRDYGVDGQIGLEESPDAYVAAMVEVFREVRRVLRPDGIVWLNLGSSYASGGRNPSRSRLPKHAPACGIGGKAPANLPDPDCAYPGRGGAGPGGFLSHRHRMSGSARPTLRDLRRLVLKDRDIGHSGFSGAAAGASALAVLASTTSSSTPHALAVSGPGGAASASLRSRPSSEPYARPFERKWVCKPGTGKRSAPSDCGRSGRGPLDSACGDPSCDGCGICWARSAIPLLTFKAKDLIPIPQLVALALQADGWWLRSDVIWSKPNPMPESITDRPTSAYEHVFLLAKSERYFFDAFPIREEEVEPNWDNGTRVFGGKNKSVGGLKHNTGRVAGPRKRGVPPYHAQYASSDQSSLDSAGRGGGRHPRNVWTIPSQPFSAKRLPGWDEDHDHYAVMPPALVEKCLLSATSAYGQCRECGAPWARVIETRQEKRGNAGKRGTKIAGKGHATTQVREQHDIREGPATVQVATGWEPSCDCLLPDPVPQHVLDPFGGAGTTALVADRHQRHCTLVELNPKSARLARARLTADAPLLAAAQ